MKPPTLLIVPGYTSSGPDHWQTLWERSYHGARRVEQRSWDRPRRDEWVEALDSAVADVAGPVVLVAHSLGCATVAHWLDTPRAPATAVAALMVAPADVDQPGWPPEVIGFTPMPMKSFPLESVVVASGNDPWVAIERAVAFAEAWGSTLVDVGEMGHINTESGLGDWPEGRRLLDHLIDRCDSESGARALRLRDTG